MTEVQALFLILGAIYLLQCVVWLPQGAVAFRRTLRGGWKLSNSGIALEALKLRGVVVNPLPPLPGVIACPPTRVFISPFGIAAEALATNGLQQPTLTFRDFHQIESITVKEKDLLLDGERFAAFSSPLAAREIAAQISKIKQIPQAGRSAAIAANVKGSFDSRQIEQRLADYQEHASQLRFACNLLFVLLFVLAPLLVWLRGLPATWPYLLAVLVCYLAVITWDFTRAHRALYPEARDQRFMDALSVALSPAGALRANDVLLKDVLRDYHPVAVAHALCAPAGFKSFASLVLRERSFPRAGHGPPEAAEARHWWQEKELAALRSFLSKSGVDPEELLGPPAREPDCNSFCPRCWNQYVPKEGTCAECADLALRPFPQPATPETISAG